MNNQSRRGVLAGGLALGLVGGVAHSEEPLPTTPPLELGPFYPVLKPVDTDADLTRLPGRRGRAQGEVIQLTCRMVDQRGRPIVGGRVELWQCNAAGRYDHPADTNTAALDPGFQGFAQLRTDRAGEFQITTIKPAPYPAGPGWMRAPHIHMDAIGTSARGTYQMMFDDPLLSQDRVVTPLSREELAQTLARPLSRGADGVARFAWTLVMLEG